MLFKDTKYYFGFQITKVKGYLFGFKAREVRCKDMAQLDEIIRSIKG